MNENLVDLPYPPLSDTRPPARAVGEDVCKREVGKVFLSWQIVACELIH